MPVDVQQIDPYAPHRRQIAYAADALRAGKVVVYPTDTMYGLGADITAREGVKRILKIKKAEEGKLLSCIFNDIRQTSKWIYLSNQAFRIIKRLIPGPYTFILPAAHQTPYPFFRNRRTVGVRIPDCPVTRGIAGELGRPLVNSSIPVEPGNIYAEPAEILEALGDQVDLFLNGGALPCMESTIIDFTGDPPRVIREGVGDISLFR